MRHTPLTSSLLAAAAAAATCEGLRSPVSELAALELPLYVDGVLRSWAIGSDEAGLQLTYGAEGEPERGPGDPITVTVTLVGGETPGAAISTVPAVAMALGACVPSPKLPRAPRRHLELTVPGTPVRAAVDFDDAHRVTRLELAVTFDEERGESVA